MTKQAFIRLRLHTKVYLDEAETEAIGYYFIDVRNGDGGLIDNFDFGTLVIDTLMDGVLVGIISDLLVGDYEVIGDRKSMIDLIARVKKVKKKVTEGN